MYSIDLEKFSVIEFTELLQKVDLLPGRRILLTGIDTLVRMSEIKGISTLADLQKILKKKENFSRIAVEFQLSEEYLTVLNREINSYRSKPLKIEALDVLSIEESSLLAHTGITTTEDIFEKCKRKTDRERIAKETRISLDKIDFILHLSDLLRINGVGPSYAKILVRMEISSVKTYRDSSSEFILRKYQEVNSKEKLVSANLGLKDIEYCRRFCDKLEIEIE